MDFFHWANLAEGGLWIFSIGQIWLRAGYGFFPLGVNLANELRRLTILNFQVAKLRQFSEFWTFRLQNFVIFVSFGLLRYKTSWIGC